MDERHWWFSSKILQTLNIGIHDDATLLEDFMSSDETLELLNDFFKPNGDKIVFFYLSKNNGLGEKARKIIQTGTSSSVNIHKLLNDIHICVYFIHENIEQEIDAQNIENEVMSGEIIQNGLTLYNDIFKYIFLPLIKNKKNWSAAENFECTFFYSELEKFSQTLEEYSNANSTPEEILKVPNGLVVNSFQKNRQIALSAQVVIEYEEMVMNWVRVIEDVLVDSLDERYDLYTSPMAILFEWRRRQKNIQSIIDQLKSKEIKSVIAALISSKSKVLKHWKTIDAGLTDAFNDVKDRNKFLESLRSSFEQLQHESSLFQLSCNVLPDLLSGIRQLDSVSRFFAKNGFLGSLLAKVCHQLIVSCKHNIVKFISSQENKKKNIDENFWDCITKEIIHGKVKTEKNRLKRKITNDQLNSLLSALYSTLSVCHQYKELYYSLQNAMGGSQYTPTLTSASMLSKKLKHESSTSSSGTAGSETSKKTAEDVLSTDKLSGNTSNASASGFVYGVPLSDEKTILNPLSVFIQHLHQLVDVIETLKQVHALVMSTKTAPQLSEAQVNKASDDVNNKDGNDRIDESFNDTMITNRSSESSEVEDVISVNLSKSIGEVFQNIKQYLQSNLKLNIILDVQTFGEGDFDNVYADFVRSIQKIESLIEQYIKAFNKLNSSTEHSLNILSSFTPIFSRTALSTTFQNAYALVLQSYEQDLVNIEKQYELNKDCPPSLRNVPIVSSAIIWVKKLFQKIETPMKILKDVKFVTNLKEYKNAVKYYNRLATVLIQFEDSWLSVWTTQAELCLKSMNTTLLAHEVESKKIIVYSDPRILEIFADVKRLKRFDFVIPESILEIYSKENRYKFYKETLEHLLSQFYDISDAIPDHLKAICSPLLESTLSYFQPGLSVLFWNSVNVDAFLHKVQSAINHSKTLINKVTKICYNEVDTAVENIKKFILFNKSAACSKLWSPMDFLQMHNCSIDEIGLSLSQLIHLIERSLQEIAITLTMKPDSLPPSHATNIPSKSAEGYAVSLLAADQQEPTSPISFLNDKKVISDLFAHYSSDIFKAMLRSTLQSLEEYYKLVGRERNDTRQSLKFKVNVLFDLPNIVLVPTIYTVQSVVSQIAQKIIDVSLNIYWWDADLKKSFHDTIMNNSSVVLLKEKIDNALNNLERDVTSFLLVFENFNFLWLDDMNTLYNLLEEEKPDLESHHVEVQRLVKIERNIQNTANQVNIGSIVLETTAIKESLSGFCLAWKMCYVQKLHHMAKDNLDMVVAQREDLNSHLTSEISSLSDLNNVLNEIQRITDMEICIDNLYAPVESLYDVLTSEYGVPIAREEIEAVKCLRKCWSNLVVLAETLREKLMKEQRTLFEEELDRDIKAFVLEVIQFRNRFDSQGLAMPGIVPADAVAKLKEFQKDYAVFNKRSETLHAVQQWFGITPTPFDELKKTGEELELLGMLYELFQRYISFDMKFRDTLWADVFLEDSSNDIKTLWNCFMSLPAKIHNWFAFIELQDALNGYLEIFPLLHKLASKEIRNRHWLQVMHVTKKSFQLEANIFKLNHIMDIGLIEHKSEIEQIVKGSQVELDLESCLRRIEETWADQVFQFERYKSRELMIFNKDHMDHLLDTLEEGKSSLITMLASKYIKPLKEETAAWSIKLNEVGEMLGQWLNVEKMWTNLEPVFDSENAVKEVEKQHSDFAKADQSYIKLMKKAAKVSNVVQCCLSGEVCNMTMLKQINKDLELCFKGLDDYLNQKRKVFPRFNLISNQVLLEILSKPHNVDSVLPYIREIIPGVHNVETVIDSSSCLTSELINPAVENQILNGKERSSVAATHFVTINQKEQFSIQEDINNQPTFLNDATNASCLPDSKWQNNIPTIDITSVSDAYGEKLTLQNKVTLKGQVEEWLSTLLCEIKHTVHGSLLTFIKNVNNDIIIDDLIVNFPCQVTLMGLLYYWTKECEQSISDIRIDRKSLTNFAKKISNMTNRFSQILIRGSSKSSGIHVSNVQQIRMESITGMIIYLRDVFDQLVNNKLRGISDFEWKQTIKCYYSHTDKGQQDLHIHMLDKKFPYHNEFLGCKFSLIMSPVTERCLLNLGQAVVDQKAGCVSGPDLVGKTEIIRGLANLLGQYLFSISCTTNLSAHSLQRIFIGVAEDGSWCCFTNLQCLSQKRFSVLHNLTHTVLNCLRKKSEIVSIGNIGKVKVVDTCRIFFTSSLPFIHKSCPASFKAMLRNVSLAHPDIPAILRLQLIAHGFKCAKTLASKITLAAEICQDQLKLKNHFSLSALLTMIKRSAQKQQAYSASILSSDGYLPRIEDTAVSVGTFAQAGTAKGMFRANKSPIPGVRTTSVKGRSSAIPHVMSESMKAEYAVIAQSLNEIIGARLCDQESIIFKSVLESLFGDYDNLAINLQLEEELLSCIVDVAKEKCLTTSKKFVDKVIQLYYVSQVNHAVVVCGPSSSGKSTCVSILIEALKKMFSRKNTSCSYKHDHVNILATSDLNFMFGFTNDFGNWVDGVVQNLLKKASQNFSSLTCFTWITLDGPLHDYWCYKLKPLIGQEKVSIKPDLERIYLSKNVKMCFETDNLSDASPTIFASMGILYVDSAVIGWKAIADAWLASRPSQQYHTLQRAFNKIVDRIILFVQEEAEMCIQLSDCTLMSSCLSMLSSLLKEREDIAGDLHIERLFLFAIIWVFGGLLVHDLDKKEFNSLLLSLTNALPDDDDGISVFDYYVDEAGEWDTWDTRLNEVGINDSIDMFGDVFVDTVETLQTKFLLDLLMSNGNNTLLVGSRCTGKSSLVESFLQKQSGKDFVLRKVAFTNATNATFLQKYLDASLYHRQGFRYGMRNNKMLKLCIDDLHLPNYDICNQQSVNQLLRQLMDRNIIYTNGNQCKKKYIEGFHVIATMNPFTEKANKQKYSQLLGKFCTIHMPLLNEKQIYSITTTLLEANMTSYQGLGLPQSLCNQIVNASTKLLMNICQMFNSSNSDLQCPYLFNVGDLSRVFQILQQCPEELRVDEDNKYFQTFWYHETKHVFLDRISKKKDIDWFNETLNEILAKDFTLQLKDNPIFTTFSPDTHLRNQRQLNSNKRERKQVAFHQRLTTIKDVNECLESFVYRYVSEKNEQLDVILHDFNSREIIKTHRILSCGNRGNMIAVTSEVEQMSAIVKLTIFMLGYHQQIIDCSSTTSFLQGLRMVARMAGCEQENVCIILKANDINTPFSLEALHSLMSLGEYAPLFSDTELNSLLAALRPTIKKVNSSLISEPKRFFTSSIKKNLHVVIITSPEEHFFQFLQSKYPAILSNSYVNWLPEDSSDRLHNEELFYLSTADFWHNYEETLKDKVLKTLQDVHFVFTKKSKRTDVTQKDSSSKQSDMLRNKILSSLTDGQHSSYSVSTFKQFLKCFIYIMENRVDELQNKMEARRLALECLAIAEEKAYAMSKEKNTMTQQYEVLDKETKRLCEELFTKSSLIERLKAKYGTTTSSFCAFMALIDSEMVDSDDELTWDDDHDELDEEYERIQSTSRERLKSLGEQVDEMLNTVELLEKEMEYAKEMLKSFQVQIDRGCIERLRAYQSPPTLVGTIMVMVMILLRRPEFSSYVTVSARNEKHRDGNLLVSESSLSRTSSARSKKSKTPVQPAISKDGKVDRKIWKTIQQIMQDSQKFCELMNTYNWCQGVSDDVMNTVVSFFAPGEEIPLIAREDPVTPNKSDAGISLQAARFSSEDAAQIVEYVQKVIHFTRKYKPYIRTRNQLNKLKVQKKEREEKLMQANLQEENEKLKSVPVEIDALKDLNEDDIGKLQLELATLQQQFDECSMSKHQLQEKILMFSNLLDNTTTLLNSMKPFQDSWLLFCDTFSNESSIITDAILSSTYSCYCGILNADTRYDAIHDVLSVCSKNRLSDKDQNAVKQTSLVSFLNKEIDIMEFSLVYPSADKMLVDLFFMTAEMKCINGWPLLCDPCNVGVFLLKKMFPNIIVISFTDLDFMLEDVLQQGNHVVVTDVNVKGLESNATMISLLKCYHLFHSSNTFKIMIKGKEVECSPKFRLFLSCTSDSDEVPLSIVPLVHCMQITIKRDILYDIFLSRFMTKEKAQIETSFYFIIKEILDEKKSILILEEQLLDLLANKKCFVDISSIKKLSNTMKLLEDSTNSLSRAEEVYRTVKQSRDVYSLIAMQAAVLFQVATMMRKVKPFYRVSIDQFLSYFDVAIKHSDRSAVSTVADKVLSALFYISSKAKLEVDRPLFALLTALEVEDSHGRLSFGDREFLISSRYGSTLKQSVLDGDNSSNNIALKTSSKKLFDWMSDEQYQNLLNLSQNYGWFSESFEKMTKDGREMQWRLISEHDTPELLALPDNVDEKYSPLQRFMVMRAFRGDRFMQAANTFVAMVLGKKLAFDGILDLKLFLRHSSPTSPILVLYDKDPMLCDIFLTELAAFKEVELLNYHVSEDSEDVLETKLSQAMSEGTWLFLNDVHHKQSLMESLFTWIKKYHADGGFRLWLSGEITYQFPVKFLHSCLPVIIDAPKLNLHKSFFQNLHLVTNDMLKTGMRSDVILIHNTCLLHSCFLQRWKCAGFAVTHLDEFQFDISKLLEASKVVSNECYTESADVSSVQTTSKGIQWSSIRTLLSKMVYGREVTNPVDLNALNALIDFWISLNATRKDFEITRARFKLPSVLLTNNTKPFAVLQAVENMPNSSYDSMEFAGLFQTQEVPASSTLYTLCNLKHLYDNMPATETLVHLDPGFLCTRAIDASQLVVFPFGSTFKAFTCETVLRSKQIELSEVLSTALLKLPRLWSKEFVSERIRKTGGLTTYNMWLLAEADAICVLHHTIKNSIQKLQEALNTSSTCCNLSQELVDDAIDLYAGEIPQRWYQNAGPSAPPRSWNIISWITDFQNRCSHVERILLQGRDKVAGYWLAAFFDPKRLLSVIIQESAQNLKFLDASSEGLVVKTEITNRDNNHLRDPPSDGIFIYGVHLWGTHWEKASNDLHDNPPKSISYALPVIHFQVVPRSEKGTCYTCPCYVSTQHTKKSVFGVDVDHKDALKYALRAVSCTLRPF